VAATLDSIDAVLDQLLHYCGHNPAEATRSALAGIQAGTIADELKSIDNQSEEAIAAVDSIQASIQAGTIAGEFSIIDRKCETEDEIKKFVECIKFLLNLSDEELNTEWKGYV
jgi:hypothetical protein